MHDTVPKLGRRRRHPALALGLACAALGVLAPGAARAQADAPWPVKPVRIIVPVTPGGSTDILARVIAQRLTEVWRTQVVVDNRPGAGGTIGIDLVAKSAPDGYTLAMGYIGTFAVIPWVMPKLPYDPVKD